MHKTTPYLVLYMGIGSISLILVSFPMSFFSNSVFNLFPMILSVSIFLGLTTWLTGWHSPSSLSHEERLRQRRMLRLGRLGGALGFACSLVLYFLIFVMSGEVPPPYKEAMINDMNNIAAQAYQYRTRPPYMRGGGGSYMGFTIPTKMATNENGTYTAKTGANSITLTGTSAVNASNQIKVTVDSDGRLTGWQYSGDFQH